jgi:UDP-glucose 4-epimerase
MKLDLKEFQQIHNLLSENNFDIIMHFAASIVVPESMEDPLKYYTNNTMNTINLLNQATKNNIQRFIFSSTAAVYGEPVFSDSKSIDENYSTNPINPYGMSKLMSEKIIQDTAKSNQNFKYIIFRYFNVAGADINYVNDKLVPRIGQSFPKATHLIKIASECATLKRSTMEIFGHDYLTHDGTCIRDYIHVDDLASAHVKAIGYLENNDSDIFNIGYGKGFSVKEVVTCMQNISKSNFIVEDSVKRDGDPAILVANNNKIKTKMNWVPKFNDLSLICKSAYEWEK